MYLSLPLQFNTTRAITVTFFSCDKTALPSTINISKQGRCRDLIQALTGACSLKQNEELKLAEAMPGVVSWSPRTIVLHNFLSSEECEFLKAITRPHLQISTVVDIPLSLFLFSRFDKSHFSRFNKGMNNGICFDRLHY